MRGGVAIGAALAAWVLSWAASAETLTVGRTYRGSVQLTDTMGGAYLPLPSGEWTLISLGVARNTSAVSFLNGYLVAKRLGPQRKPRAMIHFVVAQEGSPSGWSKPAFCELKNLHYVEPKDARLNRGGGEIHCWGIAATTMVLPDKAASFQREAYQWIGANTAGMPMTTLAVAFYHASGPKFVSATYMFNPEAAHLPNLSWVNWDKDRIVGKPDQVKYIETLKQFGIAWRSKVEQGFSGKPLSETDVALAPEADPMKADTLPSGGYRACADELALKGGSRGRKVQVTFDNRTGSDIVVHTLDGEGRRKIQGTVENAHWRRLPTFTDQPWVVTDSGGTCLRVVMPGRQTERVILRN